MPARDGEVAGYASCPDPIVVAAIGVEEVPRAGPVVGELQLAVSVVVQRRRPWDAIPEWGRCACPDAGAGQVDCGGEVKELPGAVLENHRFVRAVSVVVPGHGDTAGDAGPDPSVVGAV